MTSMERMLTAFAHKEPDRVPVYPILSGVTRKLVDAAYPAWSQDADVCAGAYLAAAKEFDIDCIVTLIDLSVECDAWGQKVIYPEMEAAHPDFNSQLITGIDGYKTIKKVDYRGSSRMMMHIDVVKKIAAERKGKLPIVAFVFGPLGTLSMMRGQQDMYMDLYDDPDAVKEAARQVNETLKEYSAALMDAGADAIMFDTLFASGSIMAKEMWIDMEGGLMTELAQVVRDKGGLVMLHNCGERIYFDAQIDSFHPDAISFLYPPADCADFAECKAKYGGVTTLIGCVTPAIAVIGTDEEWDRQCKEQIDVMAGGGGFVLATGCEYPANASFDKARRMIEIAKEYGRYSKSEQ